MKAVCTFSEVEFFTEGLTYYGTMSKEGLGHLVSDHNEEWYARRTSKHGKKIKVTFMGDTIAKFKEVTK